MPLIIDYNSFLNPSETWAGGNIDPPNQPYLYQPIATNLSSDDRTVIFSNLPAGMEILNAPQTTAPYDSVFFDIEGFNDYILMKNMGSSWGSLEDELAAAYTSGGYWAFGATSDFSPNIGCILTGSGNADTDIADITWIEIDPGSQGNLTPNPFNTFFNTGYSWNQTIPNEIMTSYNVISPSGIEIQATDVEGTPFNDIPSALRNLYVLFSVPS